MIKIINKVFSKEIIALVSIFTFLGYLLSYMYMFGWYDSLNIPIELIDLQLNVVLMCLAISFLYIYIVLSIATLLKPLFLFVIKKTWLIIFLLISSYIIYLIYKYGISIIVFRTIAKDLIYMTILSLFSLVFSLIQNTTFKELNMKTQRNKQNNIVQIASLILLVLLITFMFGRLHGYFVKTSKQFYLYDNHKGEAYAIISKYKDNYICKEYNNVTNTISLVDTYVFDITDSKLKYLSTY